MGKRHLAFLFMATLPLTLSACLESAEYVPMLARPPYLSAMPVSVRFLPLIDSSPPEDKVQGNPVIPFGSGLSATSQHTLPLSLEALVNREVLRDFRSSAIFQNMEVQPERADFVMTGTIHRFYERAFEPAISWCCAVLFAFIGVPQLIEEGEVDLEIRIQKLNGTLIKTYRHRVEYNRWLNVYTDTRAWGEFWGDYRQGRHLDKAFTRVVRHIRESMMEDRELFLGRRKSS